MGEPVASPPRGIAGPSPPPDRGDPRPAPRYGGGGDSGGSARSPPRRGPAGSPPLGGGSRVPPRAEGGAERRGGSPGGAVRGGGAGALTGDKGSAGRRRRRRAPGPPPLPPLPPPPPPPYGAAAARRRLSHVRRRRRYLRRRVKRQQEERLREQSLRALELEPLHYEGYGGSPPGIAIPHRLRLEPHHHHPHHIPPPRPWSCRHESDLSKPPCYEEALLMAEPPPPYSEVLMDTRGLYRKINAPFLSHERLEKQEQPPSYKPLFLDAGYGSALHLPRSASPGPACPDLYLQAECSPRMFPSWTDSELSSRDTYEPGPWHLPVSMPLFGRTTAV
ncbi:proline-rich protein 7 isoform 2-T2 [Theristicus caerulescens]